MKIASAYLIIPLLTVEVPVVVPAEIEVVGHPIIPPVVEGYLPPIIPPRKAVDILRNGCPGAMLGRFVVMVPLKFVIAVWVLGPAPLTEEMLLNIVPIMPR